MLLTGVTEHERLVPNVAMVACVPEFDWLLSDHVTPPPRSALPDVSPVRDGAARQPGGSQRPHSARRPAGGGGGQTGRRSAAPRPRPDPEESREHAETEHHAQTPYARTHLTPTSGYLQTLT